MNFNRVVVIFDEEMFVCLSVRRTTVIVVILQPTSFCTLYKPNEYSILPKRTTNFIQTVTVLLHCAVVACSVRYAVTVTVLLHCAVVVACSVRYAVTVTVLLHCADAAVSCSVRYAVTVTDLFH
jgi:hypothetical protein